MPLRRHAVKKYKPHQSPLTDLPESGMGSSVNLGIGLPLFQQQGNLLPYVRDFQRRAEGEEEQSSRKPREYLCL